MLKRKRPECDVTIMIYPSIRPFRRDGKGCKWPEPQESVGQLIRFYELNKKYTCWTAVGPARRLFDERLGPSIEGCLQHYDLGYHLYFITFCMIGKTLETAAPIIIFSCKDEITRHKLRDIVKKSSIMASDEYRGIGLGDSCDPPGHSPRLLAGDETPSHGNIISDYPSQPTSDIVVHTNSTISFGSRLVIERRTGTSDSTHKATAGPIIVWNGKCFCITVAHVFDDRVQAIEEGIDRISSHYNCDFDGMSDGDYEKDEEAHQEWFSGRDNLSFAAGSAHRENMSTDLLSLITFMGGENDMSAEVNPDADDFSLNDLQFQPSSPNRQTEPYLDFENDRNRETRLHIFGTLTLGTSNVGLDYALIQTAEEPTFFANKVAHLTIANVAEIGPNMVEICTVTASSGIIYGILRPELSYIRLPYSDGIQKVYTVHLEGAVTQGDCGSGVIDAKTGGLLGHIIAGTPGSGVALIVPATDVFSDLKSRLGEDIALFRGSDGQRTSPDTSMRTDDDIKASEETKQVVSELNARTSIRSSPTKTLQNIGMTSEGQNFASIALKSSISLYETIQDFHSPPKQVRDLLEELKILIDLLVPLTEVLDIIAMKDSDISFPLMKSYFISYDFRQALIDWLSDSRRYRPSFREWAKFKFMNDGIDNFRRLLASYRLTIEVALADATIRDSSSTAEDIEVHIDVIETAKSHLEANLEHINERIASEYTEKVTGAASSKLRTLHLLGKERSCLERCIQICARSDDSEKYQISLLRRGRERRKAQDVGFLSVASASQLSQDATGPSIPGANYDSHSSRDLTSVIVKGKGRSPVLWAAERGHLSIIQLLIDKGADVQAIDQDGQTALSLAVEKGCLTIVQRLSHHGADIQAIDKNGRTALSLAVEKGYLSIFEWLFHHGADIQAIDKNGRTALSLAVEKGHLSIVQWLLYYGADIQAIDKNGRTALSLAVEKGYLSIVEWLLHHGADIQAIDKNGRTALSLAAENGHHSIVKLLEKSGARLP